MIINSKVPVLGVMISLLWSAWRTRLWICSKVLFFTVRRRGFRFGFDLGWAVRSSVGREGWLGEGRREGGQGTEVLGGRRGETRAKEKLDGEEAVEVLAFWGGGLFFVHEVKFGGG